MGKLTRLITPKNLLMLISLACFGSLVFAWVMEHVFGVRPCALCLYQRYVYIAVAVVSGAGAFVLASRFRPIIFFACFLGLLGAAGLSFYQIGVETGYFELPAFCKAATLNMGSIEELKQQLMQQDVVPCDQVTWRLFGLSMASYSFIFALVLAGLSIGGMMADFVSRRSHFHA